MTSTQSHLEAEALALLALDEKRTPGWPNGDVQARLSMYRPEDVLWFRNSPRMARCIRSLLEALREAERVSDALYDSAYIAGLNAGWNFGVSDNDRGLESAIESRSGYLKALATGDKQT